MADFVFNDETKKNSHGFYLLNGGADMTRFKDNPVMLHNHDMDALIGKWLSVRIDGSLMIGSPEFDEGDELALKVKGKVDRGYLRGASLGIIARKAEWRGMEEGGDDMELYVSRWEVFECSIVSVPSNAGALALKLYAADGSPIDGGDVLTRLTALAGDVKTIIPTNKNDMDNTGTGKTGESKGIALTATALVALGIADGADASSVSAAIVSLSARATKAEGDLKEFRDKAEQDTKAAITGEVDLAIKEGRITAERKDSFIRLGLTDAAAMRDAIASIPPKRDLAAMVTPAGKGGIPESRKAWTLAAWMRDDMPGLKRLKEEDPEAYEIIKGK